MKRLSLITSAAILATAAVALIAPAPAAPAATSCFPKSMNGTPCKPFLNRARSLQYVRATLIANGFYSAGLRVSVASPQRIHYSGIQDGERTWGDIFKVGDRRLWFTFSWIDPYLGRSVGNSHTFTTRFIA